MVICPGGGHTRSRGDPILVDESLEQIVPESISREILSASAFTPAMLCVATRWAAWRGRGAWVIYGGIHARPFPEEAWNAAKLMRW